MLRIESFQEKFPVKPLGEVVDFLDNLRKPITSSDRITGEYPYYGANGLQGYINDYIFDEPLVLLAEDGGHFGNPEKTIAYITEGKYWVNNHAHVLRPKDGLDLKFLCRVLEKYDVSSFIKGATRAKLTKGDAARIPIPFPPLDEQKRIAAILDKADSLRRKRQQAIQLADECLRAVFLDMFGDLFCDAGYQLAYKKPISELTTYIDYRGKTPEKSESGIPLITAKNVKKGYVSEEPREYIPESTYESRMTRGQPLENDVLFTTEAPLGNAALLGKYEKVSVGQRLVSLRSKGELTQEYLLFCLLNPFTQNLIDQKSSGSTVKGIRTKELYQIELPIPDINKQKNFSDIYIKITGINQKTAFCDLSNNKLFESLSQKAFSGEL